MWLYSTYKSQLYIVQYMQSQFVNAQSQKKVKKFNPQLTYL